MPDPILLDAPLDWQGIARIARRQSRLRLSPAAGARIAAAHGLVRAIVERNRRAYGISTGVGALSDILIAPDRQAALSRNILMSHAAGIGPTLAAEETRAIMAAAINNFAHGYSGLRLCLVERLVALLAADCLPLVPEKGSVGYLSHMAHIGLVVIGQGEALLDGSRMPAAAALARLGLDPLRLEAKEGLCLVNGTPCATGLGSLALARAGEMLDWADSIAAMSFETQRGQLAGITFPGMALRQSRGLAEVAARMGALLAGSAILSKAAESRTQDALSLRSIPQIHGAVRDSRDHVAQVVNRELASVTDNPAIAGTPEAPEIYSQAHPVGAAMGLAMDQLAIAMAEIGAISERRIDRMVNPLVSGLPPFLARENGVTSGFMIAQYTAASLAAENRRLAAPASLDGGITSGLQEDMLCHATPAALKALSILDNVLHILAIELLAACQSYELLEGGAAAAPRTWALYRAVRNEIPPYGDDRPLAGDIAAAVAFIGRSLPG